ncbi:hypothetical protein [Listeria innocua]|uniref:DUF4190 domain-containing protein n=1 Tax=Listeria innocua TaxID=1642 RepID=A0AB73H9V7_LISIO|nr:hypothetical protein [Listeria innocua]MWW19020.1 hypothetical protein [Listeria monocytogenes]EAF5666963.1 hypothetical protein [Listeria innocua]EAG9435296.1 hypothetical protein [Listeria innocua]EHF3619129.1 hypothetical protein [Listeria innocua]EIX3329838.1 hypothetical protein [Listeria innocua]
MIQNTGELMMYIGVALCLVYPIGLIVIHTLRRSTRGKFRITSTMGLVLGLIFVAGIVLFFVGDSYRKDVSKDVMISYYEKNMAYDDLTSAQKKNIEVSIVEVKKMHESGEDISKYLPALNKFVIEEYASKGLPKENAEIYINSLSK